MEMMLMIVQIIDKSNIKQEKEKTLHWGDLGLHIGNYLEDGHEWRSSQERFLIH